MSQRRSCVPAYRLHKPSGQARVILDGRHIYLGRYGSPESREKYARLIAERAASPGQQGHTLNPPNSLPELTIDQLLAAYWRFATTYYSKNGSPTKELACMRDALRPVRKLYGNTCAQHFGPKALKAVRQDMVESSLTRCLINRRVGRIKRVFKWAVAEELLAPSVFHGLQTVAGLRYGRTDAREAEPVGPVPDEWVDAVLPYVSPQAASMIRLQRLTGMRPCEVVIMRPADINLSSEIWIYEPHEHKNQWRGHKRVIPLGPKAQGIIRPFLQRDATEYLFSPREAEAWRNAQRRKRRKSAMTPSQAKRRPKRKPKRPRRNRYRPSSYRGAIRYGIAKANKSRNGEALIGHWFPLQLRHSRGTEVRRKYGLDAAQVSLGHARADVTEVYAEKNLALAIQVARETG